MLATLVKEAGLEVNLTDKKQRGKDDRVALSQNK